MKVKGVAADPQVVNSAAKRLEDGAVKARELAGLPPSKLHRWSEARVVATIRERHQAGELLASSRVPPPLLAAAKEHCGSWRQAIALAGFDPNATQIHSYTRARLIEALQGYAVTHAELPAGAFHALPGVSAAVRVFGDLDAALAAAGLTRWPALMGRLPKATRVRLTYPTPEAVCARLRALDSEGIRGAHAAYQCSPALLEAIREHFGTWAQARAAAEVAPIVRRVQWTRKRLVAELQRLARQGEPITVLHLEKLGRRDLIGAAKRLAGGLQEARAWADLEKPPRRKVRPPLPHYSWGEIRIVEAIRAHHRKGESLAQTRAPRRLVRAAEDYCGSWSKAIQLAGFDPNATRLRPPARTRAQLRESLLGLSVTHRHLSRSEFRQLPDVRSAVRTFGSLDAALKAAKVKPWPELTPNYRRR